MFVRLMLILGLLSGSLHSEQRMVVLGDSLSDSGFFFGIRFTDDGELLWHEYLADRLGYSRARVGTLFSPGLNVAIGGSLVEDLESQVDRLSARYSHQAGDICTLWIGGNDIRGNPTQNMSLLTDEIGVIISQLAALDIDYIIVPNLPNLGSIPEEPTNFTRAQRTAGTIAFNTALALELQESAVEHSITIRELDIFTLFEQMLFYSADYGFTNISEPLDGSGGLPEEYAFWDDIHPTTHSHRLISSAAYALVEPLAAIELVSQSIESDGSLRQTWLGDPDATYDILSGAAVKQLDTTNSFQGSPAYTAEIAPPSVSSGFYKTVKN